ncbi:MAG: hypothetical protein ACO1QB_11950 [Verrucomicrobiales bacterium]
MNDEFEFGFTGSPGIGYQPEITSDFVTWTAVSGSMEGGLSRFRAAQRTLCLCVLSPLPQESISLRKVRNLGRMLQRI